MARIFLMSGGGKEDCVVLLLLRWPDLIAKVLTAKRAASCGKTDSYWRWGQHLVSHHLGQSWRQLWANVINTNALSLSPTLSLSLFGAFISSAVSLFSSLLLSFSLAGKQRNWLSLVAGAQHWEQKFLINFWRLCHFLLLFVFLLPLLYHHLLLFSHSLPRISRPAFCSK